jgi:ABC-type multidrug transport system fused ATPase/permease subunit
LRDNVGFGLPDEESTDESIRRALRLAGADRLESLPGGLDARVGLVSEGGRQMSGGQWQRLAIARAAVRDARLLVLDEPTAALDPQHETELYRSFRELAEGRTVLFVSHRLGWARHADRIVVLRDGRIVEEGPHGILMAAGGDYASMFRAQAEWYRG